jgi:hypothetical protein
LIIFFVIQKYMVSGLTAGSVKGVLSKVSCKVK